MHKSSRLVLLNTAQLLLDLSTLVFAFILSYVISNNFTTLFAYHHYLWLLIIYIPIWILFMYSLHMYNTTTFVYFDRIIRNVMLSSLISVLTTSSMVYFLKKEACSRLLFLSFALISIILVIMQRHTMRILVRRNRPNSYRQVVLVGDNKIAETYFNFIKKTNMMIHILGIVNITKDNQNSNFNYLGTIDNLEQILKDQIVDEVVFALPVSDRPITEKYAKLCEDMGITIKIIMSALKLNNSHSYLSSVGTLPVLTYYSVNQNKLENIMKRLLDITGALVGIILSLPLALFIIPAIKLDSPGSIFFGQPRVGKNGRIFKLYKFRSMYANAEVHKAELLAMNRIDGGFMFKIENDPRITAVGDFLRRTSLDELPQFFNVLLGDMSLVGTRPPTLDEVEKYERHHLRRISIKPGITGMWQISGRSAITDFDEVVALDTEYIDKWSILLDIKILLKTISVVLKRKGSL